MLRGVKKSVTPYTIAYIRGSTTYLWERCICLQKRSLCNADTSGYKKTTLTRELAAGLTDCVVSGRILECVELDRQIGFTI